MTATWTRTGPRHHSVTFERPDPNASGGGSAGVTMIYTFEGRSGPERVEVFVGWPSGAGGGMMGSQAPGYSVIYPDGTSRYFPS